MQIYINNQKNIVNRKYLDCQQIYNLMKCDKVEIIFNKKIKNSEKKRRKREKNEKNWKIEILKLQI